MGSGPPGSINHKRAYTKILDHWSETQFRDKDKNLAGIAQACIENGFEPPESLRPVVTERDLPWSMIDEALLGGY